MTVVGDRHDAGVAVAVLTVIVVNVVFAVREQIIVQDFDPVALSGDVFGVPVTPVFEFDLELLLQIVDLGKIFDPFKGSEFMLWQLD